MKSHIAIEKTGVKHVDVPYRPRLLSDNGPCYISRNLRKYLDDHQILHTRGRPFHPMTQGKIERYHRSMKNLILLDNYYLPEELKYHIGQGVEYCNYCRYHEANGNVTPADKYFGRDIKILKKRKLTKIKTFRDRRKINMA